MRSSAVVLLVFAACSGHPSRGQPASTAPDDQKPGNGCCVVTTPRSWEAPTGPRSLGNVADLLIDGPRIVVAGYNGLLISMDDGATWQASASATQGREGQVVQLGKTLLVLNEAFGILEQTSDDGATWTEPFPELSVLSVNGTGSDAWVAAVERDFTPHVLHTTNGLSWTEVPAGGASIVVPADDFLISEDFGGQLAVSEDQGKDWSAIESPVANSLSPILSGWMNSIYGLAQDGDQQSIVVSPDRGATWNSFKANLWVGWRGWFQPSRDGLFLVTALGEMLRLREPGGTWEDVERPEHPGRITVDAVGGGPDGMFVARGGALYKWNEATSTFEPHGERPIRSLVTSLATEGEDVWALVDGREVHRSQDGGQTWTMVNPPPGQSLTALAVWSGVVFVGTLQEGLFRSTDGGLTWDDLGGRIPHYNGTAGDQPRDISDMLVTDEGLFVSTSGLEFLGVTDGNFQGTSAGVLFSADGGQSFSVFTHGLPMLTGLVPGSAPALASLGRLASAGGVLFVDGQGGPFRSVDHGKTWQGPVLIGGDQPVGELRDMVTSGQDIVADFVTDPTHPSGLFVSSDGGHTFAPLEARPPGNTVVAGLTVTPRGMAALMVSGTATPEANEGVWESLDGGGTWTREGDGSPPRNGLHIAATQHELLVATNGAGVARLPLDALKTP